jgi:hypothetical protein
MSAELYPTPLQHIVAQLMLDNTAAITSSSKILAGSPEAIAFQLLEKIDAVTDASTRRDEAYYLDLFRRCLAVVNAGRSSGPA